MLEAAVLEEVGRPALLRSFFSDVSGPRRREEYHPLPVKRGFIDAHLLPADGISVSTKQRLFAESRGYGWRVWSEAKVDCDSVRPVRWPGDLRYCKLAVLRRQLARKKTVKEGDWIFWHDVDTFLMNASLKLE